MVVAGAIYAFTPAGSLGESAGKTPATPAPEAHQDATAGLAAPAKKEPAQELVASAENAALNWRSAYGYIEDIGDGQGYTADIIGFCTGTHDLLTLVERYTKAHPDNGLARYLPALRNVDGTDSHEGRGTRPRLLRPGGPPRQTRRPRHPRPVHLLRRHGLPRPRQRPDQLRRSARTRDARGGHPSQGGSEKNYLDIFLDIRVKAMRTGRPDIDTTHIDAARIDTARRRFLYDGNLDLRTPLVWKVYGETYKVP